MLIDSFLFFNEYELVELRIRYLEEIILKQLAKNSLTKIF